MVQLANLQVMQLEISSYVHNLSMGDMILYAALFNCIMAFYAYAVFKNKTYFNYLFDVGIIHINVYMMLQAIYMYFGEKLPTETVKYSPKFPFNLGMYKYIPVDFDLLYSKLCPPYQVELPPPDLHKPCLYMIFSMHISLFLTLLENFFIDMCLLSIGTYLTLSRCPEYMAYIYIGYMLIKWRIRIKRKIINSDVPLRMIPGASLKKSYRPSVFDYPKNND
jgi:hypothetical protein